MGKKIENIEIENIFVDHSSLKGFSEPKNVSGSQLVVDFRWAKKIENIEI